ncbi:MAG: methyltransferase domain-containing protein [Methanospirillum sp.]|uniref:methyltransferase domain-containing protein n=1 Tax=Methanospirillum sp. TaxID=45200 RepID=UPI00236F1DAE|nr:methyltransferase domain-containing protein [Methanospirillum sp.]MDD1728119.1 methyltransferase domain-containing protein [Methanospirillum sp.]
MIEYSDLVLISGYGKSWLVKAGDEKIGTDVGLVDLRQLIGKEIGDNIQTHSGKELTIRLPRATDFFEFAKRTGAPMLPRDIGLVIGLTGMNKKDRVLDAGTGSGIAAIFFAGVAGKVTSYERKEEFAQQARVTVREAGIENLEIITGEILQETRIYDIVHLDLSLTAEHVIHAHTILNPGGYLVCYTPFFEQMILAHDNAHGLFFESASYECIMRDMDRSERGTRPSTRVCHSGYITIMRK